MLPCWRVGRTIVSLTPARVPHATRVWQLFRASPTVALLALGGARGSLAGLRLAPRLALVVLAVGVVAVTAYGRALVADEALLDVAEVRVDVDRVQDARRSACAIERGVSCGQTDADAKARELPVRSALERLARGG